MRISELLTYPENQTLELFFEDSLITYIFNTSLNQKEKYNGDGAKLSISKEVEKYLRGNST